MYLFIYHVKLSVSVFLNVWINQFKLLLLCIIVYLLSQLIYLFIILFIY